MGHPQTIELTTPRSGRNGARLRTDFCATAPALRLDAKIDPLDGPTVIDGSLSSIDLDNRRALDDDLEDRVVALSSADQRPVAKRDIISLDKFAVREWLGRSGRDMQGRLYLSGHFQNGLQMRGWIMTAIVCPGIEVGALSGTFEEHR